MTENDAPRSWAGRQIEAEIVGGGGYGKFGMPLPLVAHVRTGTLEMVSDLGILATLQYRYYEDEEEEPPVSTFYPWSSVLWLRLSEP